MIHVDIVWVKFKVIGQRLTPQQKNVAKMVGVTANEGFLVSVIIDVWPVVDDLIR